MTSTKLSKVIRRIQRDTIIDIKLNMLMLSRPELKLKRASKNVITVAGMLLSSFIAR